MKLNRRHVSTAAGLLVSGLVFSAGAQTKWDLPTAYPANNFHTENIAQFVKDVDAAIGGKLKIRCGNDGYCVFFRQGSGCGVHEGKPAICRAWPFFRGNIEDSGSLAMAKEFCPGIETDAQHADFAREGRDYLRENGLIASDASCEANALILK